jgi:hypothetical protein
MGRTARIKDLKFYPVNAVYRRADGYHYMKMTATKHVRVERRGSVKQWTATHEITAFDGEEVVEVVHE